MNSINGDFSNSVQPFAVQLNLCSLKLGGGELELASVGPVLITNPPNALRLDTYVGQKKG